jgi:uncharacterized membrane protein (UPF0127 family)
LLAVSLCVLATAACGGREAPEPAFVPAQPDRLADDDFVLAVTPNGTSLILEVASSPPKRALGLMFREEIPVGSGMFFRFEAEGLHPIWMFNCEAPLDIAWLDEQLTVVHVQENAPPCRAEPCDSYSSTAPARYVIEVAAGEASTAGIEPGARIRLGELPTVHRGRAGDD